MTIETPIDLTNTFSATISAGQAIVAGPNALDKAMEVGFGVLGR